MYESWLNGEITTKLTALRLQTLFRFPSQLGNLKSKVLNQSRGRLVASCEFPSFFLGGCNGVWYYLTTFLVYLS